MDENACVFVKRAGLLAILTVFVLLVLSACGVPAYLATAATVEAGYAHMTANDFLVEKGHSASFAPGTYLPLDHVGVYTVDVMVNGKTYAVTVSVEDTVPPKATALDKVIRSGEYLLPEECVTDIRDHTNVVCTFETRPDFDTPGTRTVTVVLTDEGRNRTEIPVQLTVLGPGDLVPETYTIEAGKPVPSVQELLGGWEGGEYVTDITAINTALVGTYPLELEIDGEHVSTSLIVADTTPPTATVTPQTAYKGAPFPPAESFVTDITDAGPVTVAYETEPDGKMPGERADVRIVLTDQSGNQTVYDTYCDVTEDLEPPVFTKAPQTLEAEVGGTIAWRAKVEATDNSGMVELSLDTSGIDLKKAGTYIATFIAEDPAGNRATCYVTLTLRAVEITEDSIDAVCERIVKKIITDGMSDQEKLRAVFKYVKGHISYVNSGGHDDVRKQAYLGLTTRRNGDCYTFMAAAKVLLEYIGYDTMIVERQEEYAQLSGSHHFWLLVNVGTAEAPSWYHFDPTPMRAPFGREAYMMTDAQVQAYTNYRAATSPRKKYFYTFDTTKYPASATEIVVDIKVDQKFFENEDTDAEAEG